ncbi:MAG: hypothetical protein ACI80V_000232 [Rhodothermales bacterium]|jgi:hypothetical protein
MLSTLLASLFLVGTCLAQTPEDWPTADQADVESVDAIMAAVYDVISGPAGPRDWDRFRSLFQPDGQLIPIGSSPAGTLPRFLSPGEYAELGAQMFSTRGFFEKEIHRVQEQYGPLVHLFSTYESHDTAESTEPFARGINSFQLVNDGSRWWVVNIFWQSETPALPIPAKYLPSQN